MYKRWFLYVSRAVGRQVDDTVFDQDTKKGFEISHRPLLKSSCIEIRGDTHTSWTNIGVYTLATK